MSPWWPSWISDFNQIPSLTPTSIEWEWKDLRMRKLQQND
jgi:hypothetical protein